MLDPLGAIAGATAAAQFGTMQILSGYAVPGFAADAERAVANGADAVYVSNHGGRTLDHGRATMQALPSIFYAKHKKAGTKRSSFLKKRSKKL